MTTWSIQYGDETGHSIMRETSDIADVHATVEHVVKDAERTAGYAGQTATWRGYVSRDEDGYAPGNWTLDIVNLDTHTPDGYTLEEAAEMVARDAENDGNWSLGLEDTPETTYSVTLVTELDRSPNVAEFGTDAKSAEAHQRLLVTMITLSREPLPAVAEHGPNWTTWTVNGEHDTFGSWRVVLRASDN